MAEGEQIMLSFFCFTAFFLYLYDIFINKTY